MRAYYLKTRWLLNCMGKTWSIHQQDQDLSTSLAEAYDVYKNLKDRSRFPKTIPFTYSGEDYFIHAYWLKHLSLAYKTYVSAKLINTAHIIGPEIPTVFLHKVTNKYCIVQLQKKVNCETIKSWNVDMGRKLAKELVKWHGLRQDGLAKKQFPPNFNHTNIIAQEIEAVRSSPYLDQLESFSSELVDKACAHLKQATLVGPFALCHGDIHRGNLLQNAQGKFIWLDLDAVDCLPIFQELAWLQFFVLGNYPDAVVALDKRYFEITPQFRDLWYQFRLHWCVIQGSYHLARQLKVGSCLPGHSPTILRHYQRTLKNANIAFQKAVRAQQLIEGHSNLRQEKLQDILAYLNKPL